MLQNKRTNLFLSMFATDTETDTETEMDLFTVGLVYRQLRFGIGGGKQIQKQIRQQSEEKGQN